MNHGERRTDIAALAAPIFSLDSLKRHVRKAGEEISSELGHTGAR